MIRIGKIVATHGLTGAVVFTHFADSKNWLKVGDVLFLELNKGSYIPFFVTSEKCVDEEEYLVGLEDVNTVENAKKLVSKHVYIEDDRLKDIVKKSPLMLMGFNIVDSSLGSIGIVEDVFQTGHQWLAKTTYEGREVLIPLFEQIILDINTPNKFIRMNLPEGLLDI
jgi:16S rRNA processing protein RimM